MALCAFCKTSSYGCTPGRCFSPRSRAVDEVVVGAKKSSTASVAAAPLGPRRVVVHAERRSGANGGFFWLHELDCSHVIWSRRAKPATSLLCTGCSEHESVYCACGCGTAGKLAQRMTTWWFRAGAWFAPGHHVRARDLRLFEGAETVP